MQEDDYYSKKKSNTIQPVNKALKTCENQRVPVITKIESPVKKEADKPKDDTFNAALEAIRLMKKKQQDSVVNTKVNFAGQSYSIQR